MKNDRGWSSRACRIKPSKSGNACLHGLSGALAIFLAQYLHIVMWLRHTCSVPLFRAPWGQTRGTHTLFVRVFCLVLMNPFCVRDWSTSLSLSLFRVDRDSPVCTNCNKCGVISCEKKAVSLNYHRLINSTCSNKLDIKTCLTNHLWNVLIWQNRVHYFVPV